MTTDTLRQITGILRTPEGSPFPNKTLTWFRERRVVQAQGSSVVVDEPFYVVTDAAGALDHDVMAGNYLVLVRLKDTDRYFRVSVPDQAGPFNIADLVDAPAVTPEIITQVQAMLIEARAWAENPEDTVVEEGQFSALHHARKAAASAASAGLYDGPWLDTVAALLADTTLFYGIGASGVTAGDIIRTRAEGFAYRVIADGDSDYDIATAGGVRLYLLPSDAGHYNFAGMAPAANGVTDDYPKLKRLLDRPGTGTGIYQTSPPVYFPNGQYFMGQTIELKRSTRLYGSSSGMPHDAAATLIFPTDTTGIVVNRHNTYDGDVVPATTAADATVIEGLRLSSTLGADRSKHGIWLRARAVLRNVLVAGFSGNGVNIVASVGGAGIYQGNANNWMFDTGRVSGCGGHGIYVSGADANAGHALNIDVSSNRLWGIWDSSFLGNTFTACHSAHNGSSAGESAFATYAGRTYHAVPGASLSDLVTVQPGTNHAVWRQCQSAAGQIAWTGSQPEGTYRHGGGYYSNNNNARAVFAACYSEGGQGLTWLSQHSIALGGFWLESPVATGAFIEGRFGAAYGRAFTTTSAAANGTKTAYATMGSANPDNPSVFSFAGAVKDLGGETYNTLSWRFEYIPNLKQWGLYGGSYGAYFITDTNHALPAGKFGLGDMVLGVGGTMKMFGRINYSGAVGVPLPTSGNYRRGDVYLAPGPSPGGHIGFVCTTEGTAGSTAVFKLFGAIES